MPQPPILLTDDQLLEICGREELDRDHFPQILQDLRIVCHIFTDQIKVRASRSLAAAIALLVGVLDRPWKMEKRDWLSPPSMPHPRPRKRDWIVGDDVESIATQMFGLIAIARQMEDRLHFVPAIIKESLEYGFLRDDWVDPWSRNRPSGPPIQTLQATSLGEAEARRAVEILNANPAAAPPSIPPVPPVPPAPRVSPAPPPPSHEPNPTPDPPGAASHHVPYPKPLQRPSPPHSLPTPTPPGGNITNNIQVHNHFILPGMGSAQNEALDVGPRPPSNGPAPSIPTRFASSTPTPPAGCEQTAPTEPHPTPPQSAEPPVTTDLRAPHSHDAQAEPASIHLSRPEADILRVLHATAGRRMGNGALALKAKVSESNFKKLIPNLRDFGLVEKPGGRRGWAITPKGIDCLARYDAAARASSIPVPVAKK